MKKILGLFLSTAFFGLGLPVGAVDVESQGKRIRLGLTDPEKVAMFGFSVDRLHSKV